MLEVLIEEKAFGSVRPVEVVANAPISALVPALVEELHLPQKDQTGKQLVYLLRDANRGNILPENISLQASGVAPGSRLALDSYVIDGAVVTPTAPTMTQQPMNSTFHSSMTMADYNGLAPVDVDVEYAATIQAQGKRKRSLTRRAFLGAGVAALGIGGAGLGYAASRGLLHNPLAAMNAMMTRPTTPKQPPISVKPMIPTAAKPLFSFTRHQQIVRSVSWTADGMMLASAGDDAQVFLWGTNGTVHRTLPQPASAHAVAWSPDGQRLVIGAANQVIFVNAMTGNVLARSTHRHVGLVMSLAWTPRNQMQVVSGGADMRAVVWNSTNYHSEQIFLGHTEPINAISFASDGQTVASASQGGVIRVWNAENDQEVHGYYFDAQTAIRSLAFSPVGTQMVAGGEDGIIRLWNNGIACQQTVKGAFGMQCADMPLHLQVSNSPIRTLAWSPDGRFLASGGNDGLFTLWYPALSQKPLFKVQQNAALHSIAWSPDGRQIAAATGNIVVLFALS